ncbi:hypothetical protein HMI55_002771 [Coelomomyces lativittatus]|nr:hypothetical protein HMI55_002771 [Coelomomyces lativittatus]
MDGDPYGIHIYLIYNEELKVGQYLGIDPDEILKSASLSPSENQCLPLSFLDRQRGYMLLRSKPRSKFLLQKELSRALQYMLFYNVKLEIQALTNENLINYLNEKINSLQHINFVH